MNGGQLNVSVVEPLTPAIERVKTILFRPFNIGKWFVIGFCAFLAELGKAQSGSNRSGGDGGSSPFNNGRPNFEEITDSILDLLAKAQGYLTANLHWIIPAAIALIILWLLITWLSSRGRFMFLHCIVENKAEVVLPWKKFSRHADNLFVFRMVLGVIASIAVSVSVYAGIQLFKGGSVTGSGLAAAEGLLVVFLIALGIVLFLINKFTTDFVVPIMYLRTVSCPDAWREFLGVLSANKGHFFLYVLFQIVIWLAIALLILAIVLVTFCLAALILGIPYVGTVLLLPIYVFQRSYSLYYFRQFGPSFEVLEEQVYV